MLVGGSVCCQSEECCQAVRDESTSSSSQCSPHFFSLNHSIVSLSPSSRSTFGAQRIKVFALEISGHRLFGSSIGKGLCLTPTGRPTLAIIFVANFKTEISPTPPMLTTSPLAPFDERADNAPPIVSLTKQKDR